MTSTSRPTIYRNPRAVHTHEKMRRGFYAVNDDGVGSFGATPEEAEQLLAVVAREYQTASPEGKRALREVAAVEVAAILRELEREAQGKKRWGGFRPGAGRPRKQRDELDAAECRMLAGMLQNSLYAADFNDTREKLLRMAEQRSK